jgi:hypothetical protein
MDMPSVKIASVATVSSVARTLHWPGASARTGSLSSASVARSMKRQLDFCFALGPTKRRAIRRLCLTDRIFKSVKLAVSDLPAHGFGSLSQLLPNLQRVYVYTRTFPKMFGQQFSQKKARDEKILEDWVGADLKGDVDVKVVFWEPY